jgi:hypothetical protein
VYVVYIIDRTYKGQLYVANIKDKLTLVCPMYDANNVHQLTLVCPIYDVSNVHELTIV